MNKTKKLEFENEFSRIINIIYKAQEAFWILKYLCEKEEDGYLSYEKNMNSFFAYSRSIYWQVTVMEISKLFVDRDRFNLNKFLSKLKPNAHYSKINILEAKVQDWEFRINNHKEKIGNLKLQRDKVYAHDDLENKIENIVSLEDVQSLLEIAKDIATEVYYVYFSMGISFDMINSPAKNLKYNIERLAEAKKTYMENYRDLAIQYGIEDELPPRPINNHNL
jgi:hypothetical protein